MVASQVIAEYVDLLRSLDNLNARLGISQLTASETVMAIAYNELTNHTHTSLADLTLSKDSLQTIPRATMFRCLRTLTEKSLIKHVGNKRSGQYCLA